MNTGGIPYVRTRFSLSMEMNRLTRNGTAEPVSRDQILRPARGQGNIHFPSSADHEQDWQPFPVDPYSALCNDRTYIHEREREWKQGVEVNEGAQDGNGNGSGDGAGTRKGVGTRRRTPDGNRDGNGDGSEDSSGDENRDDDNGNGDDDNGNGNEDRIGEGGREAKKRKKPQNSCRRRAGNGGDTGGKRKKCRKERVDSVAAKSDNLESNKEAGGGAQGTQGSSKDCTTRERVSPLSRLIRGFRNKYH